MADAANPVMSRAAGAEIEREAFEALVRDNQKRIFRVLLGITGNEDAAETLTQECLLKAFKNMTSFRGESSVSTWLTRIAINLGRDHLRSRRWQFWKRLKSDDGEDAMDVVANHADPRSSAEQGMIAKEQVTKVWRIAQKLSPQQREVFTLRFAEEMSLAEIALATGTSLATTKVHLFRAVQTVRKALGGVER